MTALDLGLRGGSAGFAAIARGGSDARRTLRVVLGLARFTMLEAWRGRWPIAAVLLAAAVALVQGFTAATALTESSAAAPLAANAPWLALAAWTASLALELVLVCGVGLLLSISFAQLPAALLSLLAFYTMSRLVGIVMLINARAPLEGPALLARVGDAVLGALGHLLPRLDLFTRTDWLLGASGAAAGTGLALLQVTIWLVLVPAVGWLDFRNRRG